MTLPPASVLDYPDLEYRGLHFDVARNFTPKEDIFRLIDLLSLYKINVLHLHLTDDEGWRLEIPGLEELTEVGARRGHTLTENDRLYPLYGSGWNPDAGAPAAVTIPAKISGRFCAMLPGTTFALFPRSTFRAIHGLPLKRWTPVMPAISPPIPTGRASTC